MKKYRSEYIKSQITAAEYCEAGGLLESAPEIVLTAHPKTGLGISTSSLLNFGKTVFQEGNNFADGGWFNNFKAQVRQHPTAVPSRSEGRAGNADLMETEAETHGTEKRIRSLPDCSSTGLILD